MGRTVSYTRGGKKLFLVVLAFCYVRSMWTRLVSRIGKFMRNDDDAYTVDPMGAHTRNVPC